MSMPRAIFFDWDGTLVDSYGFLEAAHNHVRAVFDLKPLEPNAFRDYFGKPRDVIYRAFYGARGEEAKIHFGDFVTRNRHLLKALPGAGALLDAVFSMGIPMGLVSNKAPDFLNGEIRNFAWEKYFVSTVGGGEAAADKPSAAPLRLALQRASLQIHFDDIWFVGDTDIDAKCAHEAGCKFIFINPDDHPPAWVSELEPYLTVKNCQALKEHLVSCHQK